MIFALEDTRIMEEAPEKFVAHAAEVGLKGATFRLDHDTYLDIEDSGALRVYTARSNGELKGYAVYYVMDHPHYGTLQAVQDCFYVDPACRGRFVGTMFLSWISKALTAEGVKHIFQAVPCSADFGPILKRLGFHPHEIVYHKNLEVQH